MPTKPTKKLTKTFWLTDFRLMLAFANDAIHLRKMIGAKGLMRQVPADRYVLTNDERRDAIRALEELDPNPIGTPSHWRIVHSDIDALFCPNAVVENELKALKQAFNVA